MRIILITILILNLNILLGQNIKVLINDIPITLSEEKIRLNEKDIVEIQIPKQIISLRDSLSVEGCYKVEKNGLFGGPKNNQQEQRKYTKSVKRGLNSLFPPTIKNDQIIYKFSLSQVSECPGRKIVAYLKLKNGIKKINFYHIR